MNHPHDTPDLEPHHGDDHGYHASLDGYIKGFILSVVLTAAAFGLVMSGMIESKVVNAAAIVLFAVVQIVVHMHYFLHMSTKSEGGWTVLALVFTLMLIFIAITGSLWVMYHLNSNMMPNMHDMSFG